MIRLFLVFICFAVCAPSWAQELDKGSGQKQNETIRVEESAISEGSLKSFTLSDSFFSSPTIKVHSGSELEHLVGIRSPVLNGGAAAGSFVNFLAGIPFRAIGYGNTNIFLGTPFEILDLDVRAGTQSVLGNVVHGAVLYESKIENNQRVLNYLTDLEGRNRLVGQLKSTGQNSQAVSFVIDDSNGWREDTSFERRKFHYHHRGSLGSLPVDNQLYFYQVEQNTGGYIEGENSFRSEEQVLSSGLQGAYRNASGFFARTRLGSSKNNASLYTRSHQMDFNMHWFPTAPVEENQHRSLGTQGELTLYKKKEQRVAVSWSFDYTKGRLREYQTAATMFSFVQGEHYDYETISQYQNLNLFFTDKSFADWHMLAGIRASRMAHDYQNNLDANTVGRYKRVASREDDYFFTSPYLQLKRKISKNTVLSFKYDLGGRTPEVNDLYRQVSGQDDPHIPVERAHYYEAALEWSNSKLYFKNLFYYLDKNNYYFRDADGDNILGATDHYGIDGQLNYLATKRLELDLYWAIGRHIYDFNNNVSDAPNLTESIQRGDTIDSAPSTQLNASAKYSLSEKTDLTVRSNFLSSYYIDASNTQSYPGHIVWDFSLSHRFEAYRLNFAVRNLFNKRYAERADYFRQEFRYFPGRPRYFVLSVTAKL